MHWLLLFCLASTGIGGEQPRSPCTLILVQQLDAMLAELHAPLHRGALQDLASKATVSSDECLQRSKRITNWLTDHLKWRRRISCSDGNISFDKAGGKTVFRVSSVVLNQKHQYVKLAR